MIHLGDITKLRGWEVPVVDVITGGSPCQNFSVAGNRKGLGGDESVLFYHQIRLVKEMREHDRRTGRAGMYVRPRYCIWENVPGAFSSNGGKDFQAVLTEFARVADPETPDVPMPEKGKWPKAGCLYDEMGRWSIAWRVHDAQFWGVPQRRKRIALVADFGGLSAPEILFERKGLSGDYAQGQQAWQGVATHTESGSGTGDSPRTTGSNGAGEQIAACLYAAYGTKWNGNAGAYNGENFVIEGTEGSQSKCFGISSYDSNAMKSANSHSGIYEAETSRTLDLNGGNPACNQGGVAIVESIICMATQQGGAEIREDDKAPTITAAAGMSGNNQPCVIYDARGNGTGDTAATVLGDHESRVTDYTNVVCSSSEAISLLGDKVAETLKARDYKGIGRPDSLGSAVCVFDKEVYNSGVNATGGHYIAEDGPAPTLRSSVPPGIASTECFLPRLASGKDTTGCLMASGYDKLGGQEMFSGDYTVIEPEYIVRRLTPLECERLQGFPSNWTDIGDWTDSKGKKHKAADSPRYKALGNSIALPFWQYLARRICAQYERSVTMASLFDGISGFPLVFAKCGAKPIWTSEIEPFPVAVCKAHFGDEATGEKGDLWKFISL